MYCLTQPDFYLCSTFLVRDWIGTEPLFITKFQVQATAKEAHHLKITACEFVDEQPGKVW